MQPTVTTHSYGPDPAQYGELYRPGNGAAGAVVVIVHGGFWRARYDLSLGRPLAADLAARGYTAWNVEYRRVGAGGGWPTTLLDVAAAIDHLADLDVDTQRVAAVGHSAGGQLVTWAASRPRLPEGAPGTAPRVVLAGAVSQAGVLDLRTAAATGVGQTAVPDLLGGGPDAVPERYAVADPIALVPAPTPVVCVHGRHDDTVPLALSSRYVAAACRAGGRARLVETDGDHFTLIDPDAPDWAMAVDALGELIG